MRRRILISAAIVTFPPLLAGCAIPLGISVASYTFDAFSYATEGKSISDLALTDVTGEDCAVSRLAQGKAVCRDNTPEEQDKKNRFLADASDFTRYTDRVDDPGVLYARDRTLVQTAAKPDLGQAPAKSAMEVEIAASADIDPNESRASYRPRESAEASFLPTSEESIADQMPGPAAALTRTPQRRTASAVSPLPSAAKPVQVVNAASTVEASDRSLDDQVSLPPRLGLDLDTVLLLKSKCSDSAGKRT